MNHRQIGFRLRKLKGFYGYLLGMAVEVGASLALMAVGLLISLLGFYLWR